MSTEIAVLRALFVFSRRSTPPTLADLVARVGCDAAELDRALAVLVRSEHVMRVAATVRLSLAGLAVAAAAAAQARSTRRAKTVARPAKSAQPARVGRVIPMRAALRRVDAA